MAVELPLRQSTAILPLVNDLRWRTLSLSIGEPVDEAAANANSQEIAEHHNNNNTNLPHSPRHHPAHHHPHHPHPLTDSTLLTVSGLFAAFESRNVLVSSAQMDAYHPMEDKIYLNEKDRLYAVFDGHGGDMCSRYISDKLPKMILDKIARQSHPIDYTCVLKSSFIEADTQFLNEHKFMLKNSPTGSCGVTVLERDGFLYVCNLGDSRVQLGRINQSGTLSTILLTNDHNTKNPKEAQLVRERTADPFPIRANISSRTEGQRVGGVLLLTRAFGDGVFKRKDMSMPPFISYLPYITSEPEVNVHKIEPEDQFVVIASDGLYEHFTPEAVTTFIGEFLKECKDSPTEIAKIGNRIIAKELDIIAKLMRKTVEEVKKLPNRKSFMDDTTVIVMLLNHNNHAAK